jgi:peptidoglycan/LPS O-acetylase OafA/YrhL
MEDDPFPGWWGLFTAIGAALVISVNKNALFNRYFLSSKTLVFIGKISYPLYLWHWSLIVFGKIVFPSPTNEYSFNNLLAVGASIILSLLTYYFI